MLMMTTRLTPLALITNYTENSDFGNITKDVNDEEEEYTPYSNRPETYIVPILFLLIFIIGLTGNGVLVLTILRHTNMRNVPNTYVLSLALGDLLVIIICIPFTITVYILDSWPFGLLLCKFSECAKDISIGVSVFTLTALSADRFFAIVDPMRKLHVTGTGRRATRFTATIAVMIWVLAVICAIPASFSYIKEFKVNSNISFCACYPFPVEEFGMSYPKVIVICRFFVYYIIPLCIIAVFYMLMARHLMRSTRNILGEMQGQVKQIQARKKVAKMVMAFVIVFAVCFFPQHVFMIWFYHNPTAEKDYNAFWHFFRILGFCLAYMNSCINPIALYCVSGTFRKYFDRYLCYATKRMRKRHRRSSDLSSRGRGQSFSLVSSRKYLGDSRREQRSVIRLSTMAGDIRPTTPIKEQETTITLSTYPNGVNESLKNQRTSTEPTARDRLVT
ncbi:hypothetical protein PUN28_012506 [Cardiocondyla obscurior]